MYFQFACPIHVRLDFPRAFHSLKIKNPCLSNGFGASIYSGRDCFGTLVYCRLRLNRFKIARRTADHLLKQTREIIGIVKANILSPQEPKVQWFAAVQVRTECGHSCDILCGSAIRKVLNVFPRFCQALDIKTALYRGSGMRPFLF